MRSLTPRVRACALAATAAFVLAGCDSYRRQLETAGTTPIEADKLHPIGAEIQRPKIDVFGSTDLKRKDSETYFAVLRFVREYRRDGRGPLDIAVAPHARRDLASVEAIVRETGIPARMVRVHDRRDGSGTITLAYDRVAAVAPDECRYWSKDVTVRAEVDPYPNFGCASQRNLANMVADPTDLVVPKAEDDRNSDRRATTYRIYKDTGGPQVNASKAKE